MIDVGWIVSGVRDGEGTFIFITFQNKTSLDCAELWVYLADWVFYDHQGVIISSSFDEVIHAPIALIGRSVVSSSRVEQDGNFSIVFDDMSRLIVKGYSGEQVDGADRAILYKRGNAVSWIDHMGDIGFSSVEPG